MSLKAKCCPSAYTVRDEQLYDKKEGSFLCTDDGVMGGIAVSCDCADDDDDDDGEDEEEGVGSIGEDGTYSLCEGACMTSEKVTPTNMETAEPAGGSR